MYYFPCSYCCLIMYKDNVMPWKHSTQVGNSRNKPHRTDNAVEALLHHFKRSTLQGYHFVMRASNLFRFWSIFNQLFQNSSWSMQIKVRSVGSYSPSAIYGINNQHYFFTKGFLNIYLAYRLFAFIRRIWQIPFKLLFVVSVLQIQCKLWDVSEENSRNLDPGSIHWFLDN